MRDRTPDTIPAEIEATKLKFEKWRRSRTGQERIPETLWSEAVELARRYGTWPAARALRLDYNKLKRLAVAGKEGRAYVEMVYDTTIARTHFAVHDPRVLGELCGKQHIDILDRSRCGNMVGFRHPDNDVGLDVPAFLPA